MNVPKQIKLVPDQHKKTNQDFTLSDLAQIQNGTLEQIIIPNFFRYVPPQQIEQIIQLVKNKLIPCGSIIVDDIDIYSLSYEVVKRRIKNPKLSEILQNIIYVPCLTEMTDILKSNNFIITNKQLIHVRFILEAEKNC